ncbi:alpha/beta fold hydrolase, partial [Roseateles sp. P5_E11]
MSHPILHRNIQVNGLNLFYREAGPVDAPTLLLLHGFPSSSRQYVKLMEALADRYHLIAPDYPGFGLSDAPPAAEFG